jgi:hypothetical protein
MARPICFALCAGAALPLLRFAVRDSIAKRLRSFGDLQNVPDVDNSRRGACLRGRGAHEKNSFSVRTR